MRVHIGLHSLVALKFVWESEHEMINDTHREMFGRETYIQTVRFIPVCVCEILLNAHISCVSWCAKAREEGEKRQTAHVWY